MRCTRPAAMVNLVGWCSSVVLLLTLIAQVHKQWREGTSQGVSRWLFVGEALASLGFFTYSALLENAVFMVTNALLFLNSLLGAWLTLRQRHKSAWRGAANDNAEVKLWLMARVLEPKAKPQLRL